MAGGKPMRRRTMKRRGGCPKPNEPNFSKGCERMYKIMSKDPDYEDCMQKGDNGKWTPYAAATAASNEEGLNCAKGEWRDISNKRDLMESIINEAEGYAGGIKRRMKRRSAKRAARKSAKKSRRKGRKSARKSRRKGRR